MSWLLAAALGVVGGFVNTLAGGGSAITLPALLAAGVPAHLANGGNHAALLASALTRVTVFQGEKLIEWRRIAPLMAAAGLGAAAGTMLETRIPDDILARATLPASALALLLVGMGMRRFMEPQRAQHPIGVVAIGLLFVIGAWAGLAAVGVGSFLLWALVLAAGYDTRRAAVQKSVVMLAMAIVSLLGYVFAHEMAWSIATPLAAGSALGSWGGARFVVRQDSGPWIYRTVLIVGLFELLLLV